MEIFLQQIINGLTLGCVYAVVALGYTMVYGIIQLINFAHGEVVMIGAMVAFSVIGALMKSGMPPLLVVALGTAAAVPACMATAWLMERVAYRPLRRAPRLAPLITAIGISIILQHLAMMIWGRSPIAFPQIVKTQTFEVGGALITNIQIAIILISFALMGALLWLVHRTRMGIAMRATSQRQDIAGLMGIDINRVISATFEIGAALAAIAGVMIGTY